MSGCGVPGGGVKGYVEGGVVIDKPITHKSMSLASLAC